MSAIPPRRDRVLQGIAWILLAVSFFAVVHVLVKKLGETYPVAQMMFFRSAFALLPAMAMVMRHPRGLGVLRSASPLGHVARSGFGIFAMATTFAAFQYIPAADVVAINFAAPIFVTALSVPLLGEGVGWRRWLAVVAGFAGVMVMLQPGAMLGAPGGDTALGSALALASAVAYAGVVIAIRQVSRVDAGEAIVFFYMAIVAIATLPTLPFLWVAPASALDLAMLVALGVVGGIAQVFLTRGYEVAPPAAVMPFEYASLLATALLAWAFWGELPTSAGIAGGAIVIASGLFLFYREARLALVRRP